VKKFLYTAVLICGATVLRADTFAFSYSETTRGTTISGSGDITAIADGLGFYTITDLSDAQQNGTNMFLFKPGINFFYDGSTSWGTFDFLLSGKSYLPDILTFAGSSYSVIGFTQPSAGNNFQISRVPEAGTLSLLLAMGLGVFAFVRKLPSTKRL